MSKNKCLITNCLKSLLPTELYCLFHFLKNQINNGLIRCSFCYQYQIPTNKNYYLKNRYRTNFWNPILPNKFICFTCLYDWKELNISPHKKKTYYVYKYRYYNTGGNTPSKK